MDPMSEKSTTRASLMVTAVVICSMAAGVAYLVKRPHRPADGPSTLDLLDATEQQAAAAGIKLPTGAAHVFYKGRKIPGSATTYARFKLPRQAFFTYQEQVARRRGARLDDNLPVPASWPVMTGELAAPSWYSEHTALPSKVVIVEDHAGGVSAPPAGKYWVLDPRTNRVYIWSWSVKLGKK